MNQAERFGDRTMRMTPKNGQWVSLTWREAREGLPIGVMGLYALGLRKGDTVGIASRTRGEWSEADLSILTAGCVTIGLYPSASLWEMRHVVGHSGLQVCFVEDDALLEKLLSVRAEIGLPRTMILFETHADVLPPGVMTMETFMERGAGSPSGRPRALRDHPAGRDARRSGHHRLYVGNNGPSQRGYDHPCQSLLYGHQCNGNAPLRGKRLRYRFFASDAHAPADEHLCRHAPGASSAPMRKALTNLWKISRSCGPPSRSACRRSLSASTIARTRSWPAAPR